MKKLLLFFVLIMFCLSFPCTAFSFFGPDNYRECYEQCVLKNMKGVQSDEAARTIRGACRAKCRRKFDYYNTDTKKIKNKELKKEEIEKIKGKAKYSNGFFRYDLYNQNNEWGVAEIVIKIQTVINGAKEVNTYTISNIALSPSSRETGRIEVPYKDIGADFKWHIIKAIGYKKH